jgi:hypothetical protein
MSNKKALLDCTYGWGKVCRLYRDSIEIAGKSYNLDDLTSIYPSYRHLFGIPSARLEISFGLRHLVLRGIPDLEAVRLLVTHLLPYCSQEMSHTRPRSRAMQARDLARAQARAWERTSKLPAIVKESGEIDPDMFFDTSTPQPAPLEHLSQSISDEPGDERSLDLGASAGAEALPVSDALFGETRPVPILFDDDEEEQLQPVSDALLGETRPVPILFDDDEEEKAQPISDALSDETLRVPVFFKEKAQKAQPVLADDLLLLPVEMALLDISPATPTETTDGPEQADSNAVADQSTRLLAVPRIRPMHTPRLQPPLRSVQLVAPGQKSLDSCPLPVPAFKSAVLPIIHVPVRLEPCECAHYSIGATLCSDRLADSEHAHYPPLDHGLLILTNRRVFYTGKRSQLILPYRHLWYVSLLQDAIALHIEGQFRRIIIEVEHAQEWASRVEQLAFIARRAGPGRARNLLSAGILPGLKPAAVVPATQKRPKVVLPVDRETIILSGPEISGQSNRQQIVEAPTIALHASEDSAYFGTILPEWHDLEHGEIVETTLSPIYEHETQEFEDSAHGVIYDQATREFSMGRGDPIVEQATQKFDADEVGNFHGDSAQEANDFRTIELKTQETDDFRTIELETQEADDFRTIELKTQETDDFRTTALEKQDIQEFDAFRTNPLDERLTQEFILSENAGQEDVEEIQTVLLREPDAQKGRKAAEEEEEDETICLRRRPTCIDPQAADQRLRVRRISQSQAWKNSPTTWAKDSRTKRNGRT